MPADAMVDGKIIADAVPSPDAPVDDPVPVVVAGVVVRTTGTVTVTGGVAAIGVAAWPVEADAPVPSAFTAATEKV